MEQLNLEQLIHIVSTVISAQNALIDSYSLYENNENKIFQLKLDQALIFEKKSDIIKLFTTPKTFIIK